MKRIQRLQQIARGLRPYWRELLVIALVPAPFVLVLPLGLAFLWQQGWFWYWPLSIVVLTLIPLVLVRHGWGARAREDPGRARHAHEIQVAAGDPNAVPGEQRARIALARIVAAATAEDVQTPEAIRALLLRTVNAVAIAYTPEGAQPPSQTGAPTEEPIGEPSKEPTGEPSGEQPGEHRAGQTGEPSGE
ncbi:MAG: hypothetical protein ACLFN3_11115, partial [Halochromatium sp.]